MLVGAFVNVLLFAGDVSYEIFALLAFNLVLIGLALIWHGVYFQSNVINAKSKDLGISFLYVVAGVFIVLVTISSRAVRTSFATISCALLNRLDTVCTSAIW
jgi:hypothetical protein